MKIGLIGLQADQAQRTVSKFPWLEIDWLVRDRERNTEMLKAFVDRHDKLIVLRAFMAKSVIDAVPPHKRILIQGGPNAVYDYIRQQIVPEFPQPVEEEEEVPDVAEEAVAAEEPVAEVVAAEAPVQAVNPYANFSKRMDLANAEGHAQSDDVAPAAVVVAEEDEGGEEASAHTPLVIDIRPMGPLNRYDWTPIQMGKVGDRFRIWPISGTEWGPWHARVATTRTQYRKKFKVCTQLLQMKDHIELKVIADEDAKPVRRRGGNTGKSGPVSTTVFVDRPAPTLAQMEAGRQSVTDMLARAASGQEAVVATVSDDTLYAVAQTRLNVSDIPREAFVGGGFQQVGQAVACKGPPAPDLGDFHMKVTDIPPQTNHHPEPKPASATPEHVFYNTSEQRLWTNALLAILNRNEGVDITDAATSADVAVAIFRRRNAGIRA